jgi:gluconate 5-dehydrogenase
MSTQLFDLSDRIALITGSARGLGFVIARGMAKAGATVILNDIDDAALKESVSQLSQEGYSAHGYLFDVADNKAIVRQINRIEKEVGSIDILNNNAGIHSRGDLSDIAEEDWRRVIDVDLTGPFLVSKAVVKNMIKRRRGKIIHTCSVMSEATRATTGPYTAAKGGLKMLTKAMAVDWARYNIQVNAIGPGYFITELTQKLADDPEFDAWIKRRVPASRWGNPEELVGAVVFFASEASQFVNGQILYIDGGMLASF